MALSEAQKRAKNKYNQKSEVKKKNSTKQKENFGNIAATFSKAEKELISKVFATHGLKPSEIIRGAAVALMNGETIRTQSKPISTNTQPNTDISE